MKKYEYKVHWWVDNLNATEWEARLQEYGEQGWLLVTIRTFPDSHGTHYYFMREVESKGEFAKFVSSDKTNLLPKGKDNG